MFDGRLGLSFSPSTRQGFFFMSRCRTPEGSPFWDEVRARSRGGSVERAERGVGVDWVLLFCTVEMVTRYGDGAKVCVYVCMVECRFLGAKRRKAYNGFLLSFCLPCLFDRLLFLYTCVYVVMQQLLLKETFENVIEVPLRPFSGMVSTRRLISCVGLDRAIRQSCTRLRQDR